MSREERTRWRDMSLVLRSRQWRTSVIAGDDKPSVLSSRHRRWGGRLYMCDLDHVIEYPNGKVAALIEYKHDAAEQWAKPKTSYEPLADIGIRARLPVFYVRYKRDPWRFVVAPITPAAAELLPDEEYRYMTEREYAGFLHTIGGITTENMTELDNDISDPPQFANDELVFIRRQRATVWSKHNHLLDGYPYKPPRFRG